MSERLELIEWIRGELVGPSRPITEATIIEFNGRDFNDTTPMRNGPLAWRPVPDGDAQEVLYFERETPHRKYGSGLLHPSTPLTPPPPDQLAAKATDTLGIDAEENEPEEAAGEEEADEPDSNESADTADASDDFEVTSPDVRHPSTIGFSFCARIEPRGQLVINLPCSKRLG